MTLSDEIRAVDEYKGGDILNWVVYFRLSFPSESPFEKYFRSMTLSKNRLNLDAFVVPVAKLRASWQFKQITSAPHCSAANQSNTLIMMFSQAILTA